MKRMIKFDCAEVTKDKKILLLYCDDSKAARFGEARKEFPPLGLLYVAAACEAQGITVDLLNISKENISKLPHYEIIGLSINSSYNYDFFYKNGSLIKEKCELLVIGGQHASIFPFKTFKELQADFLVIGEGEYAIPEIVINHYKGKETRRDNIISINSTSNDNCFSKIYNENLRIKNLDELPFPARHLMKKEDVLLDKRIYGEDIKSISVLTSRGCPYNCKFCGNLYKGFFHRSAKNVEAEITQLINDYPEMGGIVFLDENLLFSLDHINKICNSISKYNLKWTCNARVDYFSDDVIHRMKEAGCVEIKYGVESGSQRMLDKMNKKVTLTQISEALKGTYNAGIRTKCFLLFGYPGDNMQSAKETVDFISEHEQYISRINLFNFSPLPNSPIYYEEKTVNKEVSWRGYRLYNQNIHWWGTEEEYREMIEAYVFLKEFIEARYKENGKSIGC